MVLQTSFPGPSGLATTTMVRKDLAGLITRDTAGNARPGIFPRTTGSLASVVAGTWTLSIAAFEGCSVRGGGPLFIANDGALVSPANTSQAPGANSRIDILAYVQHESASPYVDADNNTVLVWVYGTASASPVKNSAGLAAIPGAVELLTVLVPSTATSFSSAGVTVTETYQMTSLGNTPFKVRTASDLTPLTGYVTDQRATAIDTGITHKWNGTAWKAWESDWIAYTPTLSGMAIGTGGSSLTGFYRYVGGRLRVKATAVFGSSGASVTGPASISVPANSVALRWTPQIINGFASLHDVSAGIDYFAPIYQATSPGVGSIVVGVLGTGSALGAVGSGTPFVWAPGDSIYVEAEIDPA